MLKVLIAVDGSVHSRHAIDAVSRLAKEMPAVSALLLHVRETPTYYGDLPPYDTVAVERAGLAHQEALLEAALTHAHATGLTQVVLASATGSVAQEIVRIAHDRDMDQIVMGTRGANALSGLLLGSVAQRVVHLATMPVLLVK